jgi:hypothetical protein
MIHLAENGKKYSMKPDKNVEAEKKKGFVDALPTN